MKRLSVLLLMCIWTYVGFSQVQPAPTDSIGQKSMKLKRNIVLKYQIVNSLALFSNSFEVEAMLNKKNSVTLGMGFPTNQSMYDNSVFGKFLPEKPTELISNKLGTTHYRFAYRHYSGNSGLPRGFYIEPYLKYQKIDFDVNSAYTGSDNKTYTADITGKFKSLNAGFQLGVQFLVLKRIAIDWYFLGIEAGTLSGDLNGKVNNNAATYIPDLKAKIDDAINGIPDPWRSKFTSSSTSDAVNLNVKNIIFPWLRSGFHIGIAF